MFEKSLGFILLPFLSAKLTYVEFGYYSLFLATSLSLSLLIGFGGDKYARLVLIKRKYDYEKVYSILVIYFLCSLCAVCILSTLFKNFFYVISIKESHVFLLVCEAILIYLSSYKLCRYQALRESVKYASFKVFKSNEWEW